MINLGLIDVLFMFLLLVAFFAGLRKHTMLPFALVLIIVLLIELERFAPGSMTSIQSAIRSIDSINEQLPHIQISPIITIQS
jgi:hypothetical protein